LKVFDREESFFKEQRGHRGWLGKTIAVLGVLYTVYHILFISHALERLGIYLHSEEHLSLSLGLILTVAFLALPLRRGPPRNTVPWYDVILIMVSIAATGYIFLFFETNIAIRGITANTIETILGSLLIVAVLEATRRAIGLVFPAVAAFFVIHPLIAGYLPIDILHFRNIPLPRIMGTLYSWPEGLFGVPMYVAGTILVAFIFFAQFLTRSGAGAFFIDIAMGLFGRFRGGPAKAAVFSSALFGTLSGSTTANVTSTGVFTIPLMKRIGYKPAFAGAVETVASNGGQIMPPVMGAVAFLIAEFLGIGYGQIIIVAAVPAIIYFLTVFFQIDFEAAKSSIRGSPRSELPKAGETFRNGWFYIVPLLVLVFLLVGPRYSPQLSALYSVLVLIAVLSFTKKSRAKMTPTSIMAAFEGTARTMIMVSVACASAGLVVGSMFLTATGLRLAGALQSVAGGIELLLLVAAALTCFILGMGMSSIPAYLIVAVTVVPALTQPPYEVIPLAAHMFSFYWAIVSFITPPVAIAAYAAAAIAGANPMATALNATRLGVATFVLPFAFIYNPALLLYGSPIEILSAVAFALVGALALSAGVARYLLRRATIWETVLLIAAGLAMTVLADVWIKLAALGVLGAVITRQLIGVRQSAQATVE
jgi:TRAP transporter 4TM/12TM fusion protein